MKAYYVDLARGGFSVAGTCFPKFGYVLPPPPTVLRLRSGARPPSSFTPIATAMAFGVPCAPTRAPQPFGAGAPQGLKTHSTVLPKTQSAPGASPAVLHDVTVTGTVVEMNL